MALLYEAPGANLPGSHSLFLLFFQSHLLSESSHLVALQKLVPTEECVWKNMVGYETIRVCL